MDSALALATAGQVAMGRSPLSQARLESFAQTLQAWTFITRSYHTRCATIGI